MQKNNLALCGIEAALEIVGGKWKMMLLRSIGSGGANRFSELRRLLPNITEKMLTVQLRKLENDGLVTRTVQSLKPLKVEYSLTILGESFMPVMESLENWAAMVFDQNKTIVYHSA